MRTYCVAKVHQSHQTLLALVLHKESVKKYSVHLQITLCFQIHDTAAVFHEKKVNNLDHNEPTSDKNSGRGLMMSNIKPIGPKGRARVQIVTALSV